MNLDQLRYPLRIMDDWFDINEVQILDFMKTMGTFKTIRLIFSKFAFRIYRKSERFYIFIEYKIHPAL